MQSNKVGKIMVPLFKPFMPTLPKLQELLQSGNLAYGKYTQEFEKALKVFFGTDKLLVVSSYGLAISIAVKVLGLHYGDEVIASPMACLVSTQPYASMGLTVKWCDIDKDTGTIDPQDLRKRISSKTKLIIHNHFCGYLGFIEDVNAIAKEFNIPVIDDGIEGFGSIYKNAKLGNCGTDITIFSLSAVRPLNTIEGGVVIFKDELLYQRALLIRDCGIDRMKFRTEIGEINESCDITEVGYAAMMSNINGYIGLEQMKYVNSILEKQRLNAQEWDKFCQENEGYIPLKRRETKPNYWVYGILVKDKYNTIKYFREKGLYASGVHTDNSIYSIFGKQELLSGVKEFKNRFVAVPCGWWMGCL